MLARPVTVGGRSLVVVAGTPLEDRDETLSSLLKSFLIGGPIAVLLASGIGYLLASAGLRAGRGDAPAGQADLPDAATASACRCRPRRTRSAASARR